MKPELELTIVLAAYNEENFLKKCIEKIIETFSNLDKSFEIIIVENGSTDNTFKIAKELSEKYQFIKAIHVDHPSPTEALRQGYENASGEIVVNLDVDLSTDMSSLNDLIKNTKQYDIVIGSRYLDDSVTSRTKDRLFLSQIFNKILVRGFLQNLDRF